MMQTQFPVSQLSPAVTIVQCDAACTNIKRAIFFRHLLLHSIRYLFKYCLDIWCFTRTLERYLFKDSHSTEACDGCCKTSFQHRPLQPLIVSFLHFSQPGDLSQLPFNCEGTAVDPLQRVHVRVQHLADLMDRVSGVLGPCS